VQPLPGALPSPPLSEQQIALAVVPLLLAAGQLGLVVTILTGWDLGFVCLFFISFT
jgi:hypothetical protein